MSISPAPKSAPVIPYMLGFSSFKPEEVQQLPRWRFYLQNKKGGRTCAPPAYANACLYAIQHSGMFAMVRWSSVKMVWKRRGVKKPGKQNERARFSQWFQQICFLNVLYVHVFLGYGESCTYILFWFENIYHLERCGLLDLLVFQSV